jgi:hypothetical protein
MYMDEGIPPPLPPLASFYFSSLSIFITMYTVFFMINTKIRKKRERCNFLFVFSTVGAFCYLFVVAYSCYT